MSATKKQQLGQFMTTNYEYILKNMTIPDEIDTIIEPFCGNGDLLKFINRDVKIERYDIDPKSDEIAYRDSLLDPPVYADKYVLTNPPYLARNKATDKEAFDRYDTNDLFKCFIISMINDPPIGGIMIIPLNFISSIRQHDVDLRRRFLSVFKILLINIFEKRVFEDTGYAVCAIAFELGEGGTIEETQIDIYPSGDTIKATLCESNNYMPGGDVYRLKDNDKYVITRLTRLNSNENHTSILVKCIDDNKKKKLGLTMVEPDGIYVDNTEKLSSRTYATLVITPPISYEKQCELVDLVNEYINEKRMKYHSLWLTNYRESSDIARKRISFGLVYAIVGEILRAMES
jgi:hypothetical protein